MNQCNLLALSSELDTRQGRRQGRCSGVTACGADGSQEEYDWGGEHSANIVVWQWGEEKTSKEEKLWQML